MLMASPAWGDLFGITTSNSLTSFDGGTFTSRSVSATLVHVFRNEAPSGAAILLPGQWGFGTESFELSMAISNITASEATGSGVFQLKDIHGDSISGSIDGLWLRDGGHGKFSGTLSDVSFTSVMDTDFTGHVGSAAAMTFAPAASWSGFTTAITGEGTWFQTDSGVPNIYADTDSIQGGSIDMRVVPVPVPAAFFLGLLGLGGAGLKLKKYM
jgi:hypothetical protein